MGLATDSPEGGTLSDLLAPVEADKPKLADVTKAVTGLVQWLSEAKPHIVSARTRPPAP